MYKNIENADPATIWGKTGEHCFFCEWKTQCPFFSSQKGQQNKEKKLYNLGLM